jgi:hypothetical protein
MTIAELVTLLEEMASEHGADTEVRLAVQPNHPMQYGTGTVVACDLRLPEDDDDISHPGLSTVVYISESSIPDDAEESPYLPGAVSEALGWGGGGFGDD